MDVLFNKLLIKVNAIYKEVEFVEICYGARLNLVGVLINFIYGISLRHNAEY